ncbi:MAG: signal peptidase I [Nocardioides sp.]
MCTVTIAVVAAVMQFVVPVFHVPSSSMEPTLRPGDRIVVEAASVHLRGVNALDRGDVVVFSGVGGFDAPGETARVYVKRIVALPGETVACCDEAGRVTIDGVGLEESYVADPTSPFGPFEVPAQQLFVLGDFRSASDDSRFRGTVPVRDVIGRVVAIGWPASRIGAVAGP